MSRTTQAVTANRLLTVLDDESAKKIVCLSAYLSVYGINRVNQIQVETFDFSLKGNHNPLLLLYSTLPLMYLVSFAINTIFRILRQFFHCKAPQKC